MPSYPTIIFERARGSRGPRPRRFLRGLGWDRGALACERAHMVFGLCGTGTLACCRGKNKSCARLSAVQQDSPLIPLSSLSEPAGARPELARVGEPRASRKDDSRDIFHADSVRSHLNAAVAS
jgi:hypothetical protein